MPLYINTNIASLNAQRNLLTSSNSLNTVFERLSSGLRINSAGDDAAGLAISARMTAQVRGLTQAVRNANDGISLLQVAEGALSEYTNMLQRINELSVQAANGTNNFKDRLSIQHEVNQLLEGMEKIATDTQFNGWSVLNGDAIPLDLQVGAKEFQTISINLADARVKSVLAQPQLADPNSKSSIYNMLTEGLMISTPATSQSGSKLFSSKAGTMINSLATTDDSEGRLGTSDTSELAVNLFDTIQSANADSLAAWLDTNSRTANLSTVISAFVASGAVSADDVSDAVASLAGAAAVQSDIKDIVSNGVAAGSSAATIASSLMTDPAIMADGKLTSDQANTLSVAALAISGIASDGNTKIVSGGSLDTAVASVLANDLIAYDISLGNGQTVDSDQARLIAGAAYAANKDYSATGNVPAEYQALAGMSVNALGNLVPGGTISSATDVGQVVDNAVTDTPALVEDIPVGNAQAVIKAFEAAIQEDKDVNAVAKAALAADQSGELTLNEAKIVAAAGIAAAGPGGSVLKAATAAKEIALVLTARDAAVMAASKPVEGEMITVPHWLINTDGVNEFPADPLIDLTGASIPSDPTLFFDPSLEDSTNPSLDGGAAAGRMISIVHEALDFISATRAELGALENRLTSNISNLSNVTENMSAARSRILDADIAVETANLTRLAIMQQAGTAILAQANQQPQLALQLLG
jgi:flagellin